MNLKKIPYHLLLIFLTLGASLIIGLLSFGGLYVLWPSIIFASIAFALSVAYEGEIYLQNIKGALDKLLTPQFLTVEFAKTFLKDYFPHHYPHADRPLFFLEYEYMLHQLHAFEHQALTPSQRAKKQEIQRQLKQLEKKFAAIIGLKKRALHTLSKEDRALLAFLQHYRLAQPVAGKSHISLTDEFQDRLKNSSKFNTGIRYFSALTAIFMGIGTSYLLVEIIAIIPFLTAIPIAAPLLIVPMAIISGIAYGLLTYNTLTNILVHDGIRGRIRKLRQDYEKNGLTWRNTFMIATSAVLGALAVMLTVCTAGTWWTILKNTPPLFRWMSKIPSAVFGVLIPLVTGTAALAFNLENSSESLEMIDEATQANRNWKTEWDDFKYRIQKQWNQENIVQRLNPFRLILVTAIAPLRLVLFLGHLISIGVTADRVPGLSRIFSAFLGIVSELFEDGHYFIKPKRHQHNTESLVEEHLEGADHHHDDDLPSRLLNILAAPLYLLSNLWNYFSSQFNANKENRVHWKSILNKHVEDTSKTSSTSNISNYFSKNKPSTKLQDDSMLPNCPYCPAIDFTPYRTPAKTDNISSPPSQKPTKQLAHSFFDTTYCTVIEKPGKKYVTHRPEDVLDPTSVTQLSA